MNIWGLEILYNDYVVIFFFKKFDYDYMCINNIIYNVCMEKLYIVVCLKYRYLMKKKLFIYKKMCLLLFDI